MAKSRPKTIQIFLPDDNARGVRIAEITSRTVQATQIPRSELDIAAAHDEVQRVGAYVLFGETEDEPGGPSPTLARRRTATRGAAGVVLGRSGNRWREWVDAEGCTLDELERQ